MADQNDSSEEVTVTEFKLPPHVTSRFVEDLMRDNQKYRRRLSALSKGESKVDEVTKQAFDEMSDELQKLRTQAVVPEGHVAVKKEDADALAAYRAVNADPANLALQIKTKEELETKLADKEREAVYVEAAKAVGYKPSVLTKLARSENFIIEERDVTEEVNGESKTKRVPYARTASDDKAEWLPLDKFAEKTLSEFLPSLRDDTENGNDRSRAREFPRQTSSERSKAPTGTDVVESYTAQMYSRPSERNKLKQS